MAQRYSHEEIMAMSPEDKETLKRELLAEKERILNNPSQNYATRQGLGQTLGRALLLGTKAYTTGTVPDEAFETEKTAEPDWYTKQQIEQQNAREMEKFKAGLKPSAQPKLMRIQDSIVQVNPETGESEVLYEPKPQEDPRIIKQRNNDTSELLATVRGNEYTNQRIDDALKAVEKLPSGALGKLEIGAKKWFNAKNPLLGEWQKVKALLTDTQLLYTAKTKGAISDPEMELFRQAAANDDMGALPQIKVVLDGMRMRLRMDEQAKREAYMRNYGIPPEDVLNEGVYNTNVPAEDMSKLSDEELRAIVEGR
jgi:hypothetical protein